MKTRSDSSKILPAPPSPGTGERDLSSLDAIRRDADGLLREAEAIDYRNHAGLSAEGGLAALHARFPRVYDPASRANVEEALRSAPEGPERFRLELLREALVHAALDHETDDLADVLMEREARAQAILPDGPIPWRSACAESAREPSRARRKLIEAARVAVLRDLDPLHRDLWRRTREACDAAGFPDLVSLVAETTFVDIDALARTAAAFLRDTADLYRDFLGWFVGRRLGLPIGELESHDLSHLFFFPEHRSLFPGPDLVRLASATTGGMGIPLDAEGRIQLDLEARPGKSSRAFCARLEIPSRIMLVIYPRGGQDDYEAFFHELGHALHFAHVDAALPFELRCLDDSAVTEAWAFTLESLASHPPWIATLLREKPGKDFFRALKLAKLFLVRRYAAKIAYEIDLWRARDLQGLPDRYVSLLREATGAGYPPEGFLADVDPGLYVARYLRGWMLSSQILETLRDRFDEEWFRRPQAGTWLRDQWRVGAIRAHHVSARIGRPALDAGALTREFLEAF